MMRNLRIKTPRTLKTDLSFQKLQASTSTGTDVAQLVFGTSLRNDGRSVSASHDDNSTVLGSLDVGIQEGGRPSCERRELEHARRSRSTIVSLK